ncbi:hypothetical protein ASE43_02230 [Lysobacter sp. Root983]|nr:hypothetical protein ASE43_02230 [Lysobacter sp. Root983]
MSKVVWFQGLTPPQYVNACSSGHRVAAVNWEEPEHWLHRLCNPSLMPNVQGMSLKTWIAQAQALESRDLPGDWRSSLLRVCPRCLAAGIHLRVHQHLALTTCHLHGIALRTICHHCRWPLSKQFLGRTPAFCCATCCKPLTAGDVFGQPRPPSQRHKVADATARLMPSLRILERFMAPSEEGDSPWGLRVDAVCIEAEQNRLHHAVRRRLGPQAQVTTEPAPAGAVPGPAGEECESFEEYRAAAAHVARWFLRTRGPVHSRCLDGPYVLMGENLTRPWVGHDRFLRCCPVAIGFWCWRQTLGLGIERYAARTDPPMSIDRTVVLALYKALKSHLQYCLYVAQEVTSQRASQWQQSRRVQALVGLTRTSFRDLRLDWRRPWCASTRLIRFRLLDEGVGDRCKVKRVRRVVGRVSVEQGKSTLGASGRLYRRMYFDRLLGLP